MERALTLDRGRYCMHRITLKIASECVSERMIIRQVSQCEVSCQLSDDVGKSCQPKWVN